MTIKFSIVIPMWNEENFAQQLIENLNSLNEEYSNFEVIFVNSGSTDNTVAEINRIKKNFSYNLLELPSNEGPGIARNHGINKSVGDYIIFLDADDQLEVNCLKILDENLNTEIDVLTFNWIRKESNSNIQLPTKDSKFVHDRCLRVKQFARHHMEASSIFSCFNSKFIKTNKIYFKSGLHEDIYFMFRAYKIATKVLYLNSVLYIKTRNPNSVTSHITEKHISGYLNAYKEISNDLLANPCLDCGTSHTADCEIGLLSSVASRIREVARLNATDKSRGVALLKYISGYITEDAFYETAEINNKRKFTVYEKIFKAFRDKNIDEVLIEEIIKLDKQSWSCKDLHHSVFFAPNQVRTCCKRFFVDGEMRGDVPLQLNIIANEAIEASEILQSKRDLYTDINYGESTGCDKCPFLEFKQWEGLEERLELNLVSMEQHSICNLRCTYCDDKFYGGEKTTYNLESTIDSLREFGSLSSCSLVVWGGGEPTLDPNFSSIFNNMTKSVPNSQHRILSNSLRYSDLIAETLERNGGQLVTSVDAGNKEVYNLVRGRKGFEKVFENLQRYSKVNSRRITVKYIFTRENCSLNQVSLFCDEVLKFELQNCYFQISGDFKEEWLTQEMLTAAMYLFLKLREMNVYHVYLDEHIWQRWSTSHSGTFASLPVNDFDANLLEFVLRPEETEPFYIWGAGQLSTMLFSQRGFAERWNIKGILDSTKELIGTQFFGYKIEDPQTMFGTESRVFLSGIQGIVYMREKCLDIGIGEEKIMNDLIW